MWSYGLGVMTQDFESWNPRSNRGRTYFLKIIKWGSRVVKGVALKMLCVSFAGSNPALTTNFFYNNNFYCNKSFLTAKKKYILGVSGYGFDSHIETLVFISSIRQNAYIYIIRKLEKMLD